MDSEKECVPNANITKCAVVLLDVAGTTTSLAFVKETLFTFATDNAQSFLKDNWEDEEIKKAVKLLQDGDKEFDVDGAIEVFKKLTGENSDNKGLKTLQGLIYKKGYADKALKAHVFSDVPKTFENWSKERKVAIFSTGSIESQKLLFTHSTDGDLSQYISHYFDQSVGLKTDSESYKKIAAELKVKAEEIVFINDNVDELKAAKEAGLLPVLVKREGNAEVSDEVSKNFTVVSSFAELPLDNPNKRKKEDEIDETEAPPMKIAKTGEQENGVSAADSSSKAASDKPETIEEKKDAESKITEEKSEVVTEKEPELKEEQQKPKEQPVEKKEVEVEPMEVDIPEDEKKTDSSTENDATVAAPKESVNKENTVAEAMETEQLKETAVAEVKTVVEPVDSKTVVDPVDTKTDEEKSAKQTNKEEAIDVVKGTPNKSEKETVETENKTEESNPTKDVEVTSKVDSVDAKKNGVEVVEVKVLEKDTEKIEVAEEAKEVTKEKEQNGDVAKVNTENAKEVSEKKKDEIDIVVEVAENKTTNETEKKQIKETQKVAEPVENEKVEEAVEAKEVTEIDNKIKEPKDQKPTEAKKSSEETVKVSETTKECPKDTNEKTATEETKDPSPKVAEEPAKEECSKETKEKETEGKVEISKKETTNKETIVPETVANELKDNIEKTVKAQDNTSENKIGNGSCDLKTTEDVGKNGEMTNGQENGDKKDDETDPEETDIKIKKLETNTGSPAVSVEV